MNLKKEFMIIAVPSKSRAGSTTTDKLISKSTFFVPESEVHQYQNYVENIVGIPKKIQGITKTRNWILKNCKDEKVVMLDDDVIKAGWIDVKKNNVEHNRINDENFWIDEFEKNFDLCNQLGYKIWGLKTESSTKSYYCYKPIVFKTYALGSCMGIINDGEYLFDESFPVKEDYELCLRHIKEKGGLLGIRYLYWENNHWKKDGGCKDYRTVAIEKKAIKDLIKLYPSMISQVKKRKNKFTIKLNF